MRNRTIRSACLVIGVGVMAACGSDGYRSNTTTPSNGTGSTGTGSSAGLANPASEFCVEQGGTVEIVDGAGGQVGYCNLPDGTRIDEWEYYRAQHPAATDVAGVTDATAALPTY